MRIEKDIKNINESVNSTSGENKTKMFQVQKWILTYRLTSRQKLSFNSLNFTTFLTFLPFTLAFSQFLRQHLRAGQTDSFFQTNFPILTSFQPKLKSETFEYIVKPNKTVLQKGIDSSFLFGQPHFLAKIKKPLELNHKKFTGLSCDFYVISSGNFLSKTSLLEELTRNLDELPSYMKGLNLNYSIREPLDIFTNKSVLQVQEKNRSHSDKKTSSSKIAFPKSVTSKTQLSLVKEIKPIGTKFSPTQPYHNFVGNHFYKNRLDFYKNVTQLNSELQNFFIEKTDTSHFGYLNEKEFLTLETFFKTNSYSDDVVLSDKILNYFEKNQISQEVDGFRFMSGYKYPDMTTNDLFWFFLFNKNRKITSLNTESLSSNTFLRKKGLKVVKLETSTLPVFQENYNFSIKNLPSILIKTKNALVRNLDENKVISNEPSLILDFQKGLDWKTHGDENLRSWFHSYLSPLNPLFHFQENFFGNYSSPEFLFDQKLPNFSDFTNKSFLRLKFSKKDSAWVISHDSNQSLFVPFNSSLHIPSQIQNNKARRLSTNGNIKGINLNLANTEDVNHTEQFLPLVQLNPPIFQLFKGSSSFLTNSAYSPIFDFGCKGNPDYTFSTDSLNEENFITKYASGNYKKVSSLFFKRTSSSSIFVDNWEPLTSNSWLVVSQLSFAVFIFQVLKSLADNYGRELLGYLLDLVSALGILDDSLKQQIEILMGQRNKGFRVVLESRKTFTDIVGIQKLLPEIYEVVWFLRNSAREFALSKTLPRGILLTGPPGTGKTLLVQALAGEAQVPVIVLSGSSLIEPGESGAVKLEMVFQEARQLAPCIVFIDEIDTLSAKRSQVIQNPMGADEVLESLISFEKSRQKPPLASLQVSQEILEVQEQGENALQPQSQQQQLSLLTQLLIELDGIQGRDGVIVIGATNRPEVLDSALLRPGRFDKILQVGLPGQQKRVEILQFYGQGLGYQEEIPWHYLGERTAGFTAADLATLMNESTIKAILNQSSHTIETIEHGIDRLTTSESEKYTVLKTKSITSTLSSQTLQISSKLAILRLAYYQAGKIVLSHILETHPKSVFASLWPRRPTIRSVQITTNLQKSVFEFLRLREVADRLVGCYAGKAAEFLFLEKFASSGPSQISTLGLDDLVFAQNLIYSLLENWGLSKKSQIQRLLTLRPNVNLREFRENPDKLDFYNQFVETIEIPPMSKALETQTSSLHSNKGQDNVGRSANSQMYYSVPWWQQEISAELEFVEKNFANGSRLYLSNPEQSERNPEWVPPDEFYHSSSGLKNVKIAFANLKRAKIENQSIEFKAKEKIKSRKLSFPWNDVSKLTRDYPSHSLVLQSFNKALEILNQNRELLDRLVIELLYQEVLRQPEVEKLLKEFTIKQISTITEKSHIFDQKESICLNFLDETKTLEIVEGSWGPYSRKPLPKWIDFAELRGKTT